MILKDYIFVLGSYACNKKCPYCIAKMTKAELPSFEEQLEQLKEKIKNYQEENIKFQHFILSGNGEPSLYKYDELNQLKEIVESSNLFLDYRIQTSGNLFFEEDKLNLFNNWLKEITVVSANSNDDKRFYNYQNDYLAAKSFLTQKRIRVNIVLLKNNFKSLLKIIDTYAKLNCVETIALKILDNPLPETKEGAWISKNALSLEEITTIIDKLNTKYHFLTFSQRRFIYKLGKNKLLTVHFSESNTYDSINIKKDFSWHNRKIKKGIYGTFSKVEEEVEEAKDALEQNNHLMLLIELSDIIGAIEKVAESHNISLNDLIAFSKKVKESKKYEK